MPILTEARANAPDLLTGSVVTGTCPACGHVTRIQYQMERDGDTVIIQLTTSRGTTWGCGTTVCDVQQDLDDGLMELGFLLVALA
jgi:hypothetical protein